MNFLFLGIFLFPHSIMKIANMRVSRLYVYVLLDHGFERKKLFINSSSHAHLSSEEERRR